MCHAVTCTVCGKTTWQGCGQHVDEVRAGTAGRMVRGHTAAQESAPRR